ncbi:MAG: hypothetical protein NTU58_00250 [Candidatus Nealsonbacteria bacterium]|nr:hypothetical protein [Candidatus Nealsonbacteria bacterium]
MLTVLKNKKNIFILGFLLVLLILPRIAIYPIFGVGIVGTDAQFRYFPQAKELSESFGNFFNQTGPAYSLFLLFFEKINNDMVAGPVLIQHIIGIITALLVFCYFKKINLPLAFFVTIFTYSAWTALWIEHTILRESLASFLMVILVILVSLAAKELKYFKFIFAFLTGLIGLALVFIRIEFVVLLIFMPLILFIVKKKELPNFKFKDRNFLKWNFGYFCPFFIVFIVYFMLFRPVQIKTTDYGSFFIVSYYSLIPETFYYNNSRYAGLLNEYQEILETAGTKREETSLAKRERMAKFDEVTSEYLSRHPEIKLSKLEIMDKIYIEIMIKNTLVYLESFGVNLKNHLLGTAELDTLIFKDKITDSGVETKIDSPVIDKIFHFHNIGMKWFSTVLFWLFLPSTAFLFIKWKSLPSEVIISFFITVIHILVLSFLTNPAHRFRYPIDPFIYFLQFYLILTFFNMIFFGKIKLLYKRQ